MDELKSVYKESYRQLRQFTHADDDGKIAKHLNLLDRLIRRDSPHFHTAYRDSDACLTDKCGLCGRDLRDGIHHRLEAEGK